MPKIFISARRDGDADATQAIYKQLAEHYGSDSVVIDETSLWLGVDFILKKQVSQCDALLVIIGDGWVSQRMDAAADIVQSEVSFAVESGIPVIPVLVDRASTQRLGDLPEHLRWLAHNHAAEVRPGRDYQSHLERLVQGLDCMFEQAVATSRKRESRRTIESGGVVTNSIGMQLKLIPASELLLTSPDSDNAARKNEKPQHPVRIKKPFYLGIYVVTQEQYEDVMGARWRGKPFEQDGPDYPQTCVSWHDAVKFCRKLSQKDGKEYQLPTEAEWEYACRAGTITAYSYGDDATRLGQHAWYDKNAGDDGQNYARRVGEKEPNPWGLYDMHGNVWEWCKDEYTAGLSGRVLRGGSFGDSAGYCRSVSRHWHFPDRRLRSIGFRVARTYP